jgi:hypothetical protein
LCGLVYRDAAPQSGLHHGGIRIGCGQVTTSADPYGRVGASSAERPRGIKNSEVLLANADDQGVWTGSAVATRFRPADWPNGDSRGSPRNSEIGRGGMRQRRARWFARKCAEICTASRMTGGAGLPSESHKVRLEADTMMVDYRRGGVHGRGQEIGRGGQH